MTVKKSGAWELRRGKRIYRAADFDQLLSWVRENRVSSSDSFRKAGTDQWLSVLSREEFAAILNPDNQWTVSMRSGVFRTPEFEVLVKWAREARITEDAVVEGPRTPPGGVKASALPALAPYLREVPAGKIVSVKIRVDGNVYKAGSTDIVRSWIKESRIPVDAEISMDGKTWEPVSMCGLFDLEDWPQAAYGAVEEEELPDMPAEDIFEKHDEPVSEPSYERLQNTVKNAEETPSGKAEPEPAPEPSEPPVDDIQSFTVVTAESEIMVESAAELKKLLKRRQIYSYDVIRHPSIKLEGMSVGEYLEIRQSGKKKFFLLLLIPAAAAIFAALEYAQVVDAVTWL
ncbi:hypothetical protein CSA37_04560 [Candidatus Fermentibacteria bacterium]|nr:MAG: hypothetical protein CSA37_06910 [Candidatus Fermentibacteria bacterium]PIE52920.1 MAG: hypothetical protein CSA37_04560 [Candidatus Fermentibacteria bacterium]